MTATTLPNTAACNSDYGAMADAKRFIAQAHQRGLRVIAEFVINHTWTVSVRASSRLLRRRGTFYVWSDETRNTTAHALFSGHRKSPTDLGTRWPAKFGTVLLAPTDQLR